ncbi:MAG: tol-pal system-associated acyl-CoA thioesterase [Burkholderiales bacterium]|nr:MAG: tol-pal system-associated acyl-CoA thioesterase [Burkholderiales bacterium]
MAAARAPLAFSIPVRVYYEDTDAGGIVYHANWLRFFERARTDWLRALGAAHTKLADESGLAFVVREIAVDYRRPARLDDLLRIEVRLLETRRASWTLWQGARLADEAEPLVTATVRIATIRRSDGRPAGFPRWLNERLAAAARGSPVSDA